LWIIRATIGGGFKMIASFKTIVDSSVREAIGFFEVISDIMSRQSLV